MPLNVPENNEDVTDLENQNNPVTVGAYSVPLNGAPKGPKVQNEVQEPSHTRSTMYTEPDLVCINIRGKKFVVLKQNFERYPDTRLGILMRCQTNEERLRLCHRYFDGDIPEYYFDMNWEGFNDILDVYRFGRLHFNSLGLCPIVMNSLTNFWQIDELLLDACCALRFYPKKEECSREIEAQEMEDRELEERLKSEDFGSTVIGRIRKLCWNITEYPETSLAAKIYAFFSLFVVILSTIIFILTTQPELDEFHEVDVKIHQDEPNNSTQGGYQKNEQGILVLKILDHLTMVYFTFEYVVRFICSPKKWKFLKSALNIVDLLAIIPYYANFVLEGFKDTLVIGRAGKLLRLVRVMRILRVFKLVKHFTGLQSLLSTLGQVYKEIFLLMVLISVCVLTLSSLIYFSEKGGPANWSFGDSFWWGLMCITTVGQGSNNPDTTTGKMIGSFTALLGVFMLALPVPLLLNQFSINYKNRIWKHEVMLKKSERSAVQQSHQINGVVVGNGVSVPVSENNIISVTHNVSTKNQITPIGEVDEDSTSVTSIGTFDGSRTLLGPGKPS